MTPAMHYATAHTHGCMNTTFFGFRDPAYPPASLLADGIARALYYFVNNRQQLSFLLWLMLARSALSRISTSFHGS